MFGCRRQISEINNYGRVIIAPMFFSDAMPGPHLRIPPAAQFSYSGTDEISNELREWFQMFSLPTWLPNSIDDLSKD